MYSYQVVFEVPEIPGSGRLNEKTEYIVAKTFKEVYERIQKQIDTSYTLIAIIRRNPIIAIIKE